MGSQVTISGKMQRMMMAMKRMIARLVRSKLPAEDREKPGAKLEAGLSQGLVMLTNLMMKPVVGKHFSRVNGAPIRQADWCHKR